MQGQRSTIEQFPEAFEFNHGSNSNAWTNVPSPGDAQNLPEYLLTPSEPNMPYRNVVNHEAENLREWNLGSSSSMEPIASQNCHVETKMDPEWISSLTGDSSAGPSLEVRTDTANMLSLDNVDINLNVNQVEQDQFSQNSSSNDASLGIDCNAGLSGNGVQVPQTSISPLYNPFVSEAEQIPSASCINNPNGSSSGYVGNVSENTDVRLESSLDSRRLSGKRKNIEGFSGQSSRSESHSRFQQNENGLLHTVSAGHISSSSLNMSASSGNISSANAPEEHLNPRYNAARVEGASECLLNVGSVGSSQRNFRLRVNPGSRADLPSANLWPVGNSSRRPDVWSPHQPSALLVPLNQSLEARLAMPSTNSQNQSHLPSAPGLARLVHPLTRNGTSSLQIGSSSNSPPNCSNDRLAAARGEIDIWNTQRNIVPEQSMVVPANDVRHVAQDPTDWSLANGSVSIPGIVASTSRASSSSGAHPTVTPSRVPHHSRPTQYEHTVSEFVHGTLSTASPDSVGHVNDFLPQRSGHSSSPQEIARQPGVGFRTHQQQLLRSAASAILADRRHDAVGAPITLRMLAAAREGRSRIISEHIRNALDLMRRGENIRFEELLALGERIGNVSTGLNEETILKHLKQRKHLSITSLSSNEVEPCCICQENYLNNEDIGTLDCGHDFHAACIKQWLIHKNLCPICKMTALGS
ncbi:hypothetical protein Taro_003708 [Colocasia esculenta]|uniref:RING-type E3 ubiquitin transferase n=1 Tax=Colocasia esculenta TaxID=4460 RepID=A0A843TPH4_COLES|nr:hypothetical protein [Colocasia esculenta]